MSEVKFTDANFEEKALKVSGLVLVDFYADWCGPCQMMGPHIDALAGEMSDVTIGKMNVDENQGTAAKYQVMSIPTLIFLKDGEIVEKISGYQSKEALSAKIGELK